MAAAKKPWKTGASSGHIKNLKQSILETFDIYDKNTFLFTFLCIRVTGNLLNKFHWFFKIEFQMVTNNFKLTFSCVFNTYSTFSYFLNIYNTFYFKTFI